MPVLEDFIATLELEDKEKAAILKSIGSEKVRGKFEEFMVTETTKRVSEAQAKVDAAQAALDKKIEDEDKFLGTLKTYGVGQERDLAAAQAAREQAESTLAAAEAKLAELSTKYAIPDDETKVARAAVKEPAVKTQEFDAKQFVGRSEFETAYSAAPQVSAILLNLERRFDKLFAGTDVEFDPEKVLAHAQSKKVNLKTAFDDMYKVADRQRVLDETATKKRIDEEVLKATQAVRDELALQYGPNAATSDFKHAGSPLLDSRRAAQKESGTKPAPGLNEMRTRQSRVESAARAYMSGKHHEKAAN